MSKSFMKPSPHPLQVWQESNGISDELAMKKFDIKAKRTLDRWKAGENFPTLSQAQMIDTETNGAVGLYAWKTPYLAERKKTARRRLKSMSDNAPAANPPPVEVRKPRRNIRARAPGTIRKR